MKLKFTVTYSTQWGEALYVVLSYASADGPQRSSTQVMTTQDGLLWTLETALMESRQRPVTTVTYHYELRDADGHVLRREWDFVPRTYSVDSSLAYVFTDQWRDRPLCAHLFSRAYLTYNNMPADEPLLSPRLPLYRRTLLFRLSAPQLLPGQSLAILGSHPALGSWSPARFLRMQHLGQREWMLSVSVDAVALPIEYKYVVVDDDSHELLAWEEGDNRVVAGDMADGEVRVVHGELLRLAERTWRAAGVVVPVFALRSDHDFGVGDFGDIPQLVDWALQAGLRVLQFLPVNDTTTDGRWHDSCPYDITSAFALHPHYLDLSQLGPVSDEQRMTDYRRRQRELNALPYYDYEAVGRVKRQYAADIFADHGRQLFSTPDFTAWRAANDFWLSDYARWCAEGPLATEPDLTVFMQYHLHRQLSAAADYARTRGVVLKGDVPIGVSRQSAEVAAHPDLFCLDSQAGTPPDASCPNGANWGFPTYCWDNEESLVSWFHRRFAWMEQYFDAVRLDHVLAFFRTWEIPAGSVHALLGHFAPALPFAPAEMEYFGLPFRRELLTRPFVNDRVLEQLFGLHAAYVRDTFLVPLAYGLYGLRPDFDTQQKVLRHFHGRGDENSLWIRDGLLRLLDNVLFVEDPRQPGMYHPRIAAFHDSVFQALSADEQAAYMRLYNNYYAQRHNAFWGSGAMRRLGRLLAGSRLLVCAEDLGQLPECVAPVLDALRILTLEVQALPKVHGFEFSHLDAYPYRSVATFDTHDMAPLRLWWEENPERTQRYYAAMLQKEGRAPEHLPAHLAEEIVARHLYSPAMLCLLSLQDWLAIDGELRCRNPREERINQPHDPYNRWQWRMHLTLEELAGATRFSAKLHTMVTRSRR